MEQAKIEFGKLKVGNKEAIRLKAEKVKILGFKVTDVKKNDKIVGTKVALICQHPSRDESIEISSVTFISRTGKDKKVKTIGLWLSLDEDGEIQKGSALAVCLNYLKANDLEGLTGKETDTEIDEGGYLSIKAY